MKSAANLSPVAFSLIPVNLQGICGKSRHFVSWDAGIKLRYSVIYGANSLVIGTGNFQAPNRELFTCCRVKNRELSVDI